MELKNRATYSYTAIAECIKIIKQINTTVNKKVDHFAKLMEIKKAFDFCYDKTGCCLFDTRYTIYEDYNKAVELKETKKICDKLLKACVRYLQNEITAIYEAMEQREVNIIK